MSSSGRNNLRVTNRPAVSAVFVQSRREERENGECTLDDRGRMRGRNRWKRKEYCGRRS